MKNTCYKCERRTAECHSTCPEYKEAKAKHEEVRLKIRQEQAAFYDAEGFAVEGKIKTIKRIRSKKR